MMSGKWHLGLTPDRVPAARGFEHSFSLLAGCHNHYGWEPSYKDRSQIPRIARSLGQMYFSDDKPVAPDELPKDFYSTDNFTEILLGYLKDREALPEEGRRPFFAYLSFSAPHWPLQAAPDIIKKYRGMYDDGPEALRQRRLASVKKLGLVPENAVAARVVSVDEDGEDTATWEELTREQKAASARAMETYAAMVDRMDWNIGRVIDYLRETRELDDTVVMFLSDNGAEGAQFEAMPLTAGGDMGAYVAKYHDNSLDNIGAYNSFVWYGARWASASTAPGLLYKSFTSEGGIRVPLILRYPQLVKRPGDIDPSFSTVLDILPTVLDICGVAHPGTTYHEREVAPVVGTSWVPHLKGEAGDSIHAVDHVMGWELFGRRALRQGGWKALYIPKPYGPGKWQLFNVLDDPGETKDLAEEQPQRTKDMIRMYEEYCIRNGVVNLSANSPHVLDTTDKETNESLKIRPHI